MKKREKILSKERISVFPVSKDISNDEVLQMIYRDFSKKLDFINSIYPYSGKNLFMYDIMYKHFNIPYEPIFRKDTTIEYFSDTYEEFHKAYENRMFNVGSNYFGGGEWPIILFDRMHDEGSTKDWISYTISR